ncbi:MAG: nucleotide exchange factor GrpE [Oscillospiraceae bacterium]|nr:nucleotide exchange factor GrpE [Oscillospiraceae bacterium]
MTEEEKTVVTEETPAPQEEAPAQEPAAEQAEPKKKRGKKSDKELEELRGQLAAEQDKYLRMAAEYDNYRKRSMKEKDHIYNDGVADTLTKFLPIYDNLERALQQQTADEAYKKGVEMIMTAMKETLTKCGVTVFGEVGEVFDPAIHNAVMHVENESLEENTIETVFQKGFRIGEKVVRFAMVRVAN